MTVAIMPGSTTMLEAGSDASASVGDEGSRVSLDAAEATAAEPVSEAGWVPRMVINGEPVALRVTVEPAGPPVALFVAAALVACGGLGVVCWWMDRRAGVGAEDQAFVSLCRRAGLSRRGTRTVRAAAMLAGERPVAVLMSEAVRERVLAGALAEGEGGLDARAVARVRRELSRHLAA